MINKVKSVSSADMCFMKSPLWCNVLKTILFKGIFTALKTEKFGFRFTVHNSLPFVESLLGKEVDDLDSYMLETTDFKLGSLHAFKAAVQPFFCELASP